MSYMINLTNIIGEFPAWNLSTETRKNKYLEFEAPKRKFQRELNILNYTKCSVRDLSFFAKYPLLKKIISGLLPISAWMQDGQTPQGRLWGSSALHKRAAAAYAAAAFLPEPAGPSKMTAEPSAPLWAASFI